MSGLGHKKETIDDLSIYSLNYEWTTVLHAWFYFFLQPSLEAGHGQVTDSQVRVN